VTPIWDLNADLGEGDQAMDDVLLEIVTSANVACGGHAGDDESMRRICAAAAASGVAIGAQVSYVDREGFGRRRLDVGEDLLAEQIAEQIRLLGMHARAEGTDVAYVKPHGALYHAAVHDVAVAEAVLRGSDGLPVLTLPHGSLRERALAQGTRAYAEAFADRGYTAEGNLVPRGEEHALLDTDDAVKERVQRLVEQSEIVAVDSTVLTIDAHSICVHSDTPGADALARAVRIALEAAGVRVAAFTHPRDVE
jgi:UPF0271 protein